MIVNLFITLTTMLSNGNHMLLCSLSRRTRQVISLLVALLLTCDFVSAQEDGSLDSKITLLPWSQTPTVLQCGRTYTSADFDIIKSGSMRVSDDGATLFFENLVIKSELTESEGDLFYTTTDKFSEAELKKWSIVLTGDNVRLVSTWYFGT